MYRLSKLGAFMLMSLLLPGVAAAQDAKFTPPITATTISGLLENMIGFMLGLVGIAALGALIWGGTLYILSFGDEQRMQQGKRIVLWAIAGLAIIMLSYVIINTVAGFLGVANEESGS